jgi:beta-barrel assembly-enhancing protease
LETKMQVNSIRKFGASVLVLAMWFGITALPATVSAQTQADDKTDKKDKKDKNKDKKAENQTQNSSTNAKRPLAENENPDLIGKRNINKGFSGKLGGSQEKEVAIGRQVSAEIEQQVKLTEDPIITEYVNRVGQNIVLHSDSKIPFTIKVINSDEINAFALPGGFFYVNTGLILAADNESELAGVMAHEIAHVAARHAVENNGKSTLLSYGMLAATILTGGVAGNVLYNASGLIQGLVGLKFSRGAEEEADRLGTQYMYAAGYDPTGMATMFEKITSKSKKKAGTLTKLFSTHPQTPERRDASLALAARFAEREEYVLSTSEFQRVKGRLLKLTNAKASTSGDIDEGDDGKPTLKRRQPADADQTDTSGSSSSSSDSTERPELKRRDAEPKPTPTPKP